MRNMSFQEWFKENHNTLIDLVCDFIKEEKVYDVNLDEFTQYMYTQTSHCKIGEKVHHA